MPIRAIDNPILKRFRAALDEIYGDRLERVVLFGSHARGDARADSDYDIAVFMQDLDLLQWLDCGLGRARPGMAPMWMFPVTMRSRSWRPGKSTAIALCRARMRAQSLVL